MLKDGSAASAKENQYDKLALVRPTPKHVPNPLYESSETLGIQHPSSAAATAAAAAAIPSTVNPDYSVPKRRRPSDSDDADGTEVPTRPARPDNSVIFKIAQRPSGEYLQLDPAGDGPSAAASCAGGASLITGETLVVPPVPPERPDRPTATEMLAVTVAAPPIAAPVTANYKRPLSNGSIGETATDDVGDDSSKGAMPTAPPRRKRKKTAAAAAAATCVNADGPSFPPPQPPS